MEFQQCIESRRSIRAFNNKPVSDETITQIVDAAVFAPSWKNTQVTRYYAVKDEATRAKIVASMPEINKKAASSATVLVVSTVVKARSGYNRQGEFDTPKGKGWQMYDCGCSNMIFTLKANELGLGTVIMGVIDDDSLTEILQVPDTEEVVSVIAMGYYDEPATMPKRKGSDVILKII